MYLLPEVLTLCTELKESFDQIPSERKEQLLQLSEYISDKINQNLTPHITVICTHNSRRSHMGQIWLAVATDYYKLPDIQTYSGGTEATAFNPRAVNAFNQSGFNILSEEVSDNPIYWVRWNTRQFPYPAFSKKYSDTPNPSEQFAAIMVCTDADEHCPIVHGCDYRLSLPYDDPKAYDDTELESQKYMERLREIGREMLFVMSAVG